VASEIERKFLVTDPPRDLDRYDATDIRQGYLAVGDTEVRVRDRDGATTLTVKQGSGRVRAEEEIEIDSDAFDRLWPLTEGRRIEKRRYLIPDDGGHTIELDAYRGDLDGLVVAEVEFDSEDDAKAWERPAWIGRELTGDGRYSNQRLALGGLPDSFTTK
jgi:adenylate cyclase